MSHLTLSGSNETHFEEAASEAGAGLNNQTFLTRLIELRSIAVRLEDLGLDSATRAERIAWMERHSTRV